jgi:chromosome segregation protein
VHFDHDVLAIVGPNGCGKSNIVDAIRWCMGEQSARHLRGRSMDDVIFSGSESRSPHDFAEVTITFENDDPGDLPLEYKEYSEVAVTRRLHRTGESEYLVNKTPVRLRDVTDLFLGTGAGTKAYSIVEQGKVGLIVSAKPDDRRLLIEEAAGITKFKARKKQAEKKMELTQLNLLRVADIVSEIDRSLSSLKRQAAKAERFVAYRDELEDLQLHEAAHRFLELAGWINFEATEVERAAEAHGQARCELETREAELEVGRLDVLASEERLEKAHAASVAADQAVQTEESAIARAKDRLSALTQRERQAETEKDEMVAHAARLSAEQSAVAEQVATLSSAEAHQATEIANHEAALADFTAAHAIAEASVADKRQTISSGRSEMARAEGKLAGFQRRQAEMSTRLDRLKLERESLEVSRAEIATRAEHLVRSVDELRAGRATTAAQREALEQRLIELRELIVREERALEVQKTELSTKRSRHGALREMHGRLEGAGAGTKAIVNTQAACLAGLVADRIEAPAELTQALAGLLGARLQDVVVRNVDDGIRLLEDLARGGKGRAAIVPLHAPFIAGCTTTDAGGPAGEQSAARLIDVLGYAPEDEALARSLVGEAIIVPDLPCARRLRKNGAHAVIVTQDGFVLHADGRVQGGQGDAVAAGMLETKREARELARELQRLDAVVGRQIEALQKSRGEMSQAGAALDRARHEAHARELALVTAEKDFQKAEGQLELVERRLQALLAEEGELARAIEEAAFEREEASRGLVEARARVENAEEQLRDSEAAMAEARARVDTQRQVLTSAKVSIAGVRERLAGARGTALRLARSAKELEDRANRVTEELGASARAFSETAAQLVAHEERLHLEIDRARDAREALAMTRAAFEELRVGLLDRETTLKEMRSQADGLRDQLQAHEMALREKQLAIEHLLFGISEKFRGLHLPRVVGDYHLRPPPDGVSRSRIEELARLIERMGSVNLDAVREHAEAEQRFTFYTTQKADLEKALADLQRAIQQMNRESRRLFEQTFEAINERFREIFPRMFRGGRAELRMTNPDDLLETGIDIVAQPPGKKLSSIELMSGGEKALTAVSLIFAIFQIKPSPFCILDEVDAPLDEANVARYNEMVRSMTDRSQFILITHIKRTMQMVDVLYGVTMPEAGVSKIVSVKINDTEHRRNVQPEVAVA